LPHSDILGSKPVCGSPKLFAAYHVLHRLLAPRHSPYALSSLTIRNSRLTPIAASRLAGSRVRTCRTANRELRIAACDSPLHTACVLTPPALAGAVDCGRKKLPFAGYSVVKESVKLSALQLLEVRLRLSARARQPLSKLMGRRRSQQAPFLLRARRHSPELAIVTSATPKCKLKCNLSCYSLTPWSASARSAFALSGYGATAFVCVARRQRARLPSRSPLPRQLRRAKAGGEYRARTGDLLVANQALSQLS
jgi:hypothetical protein